MYQSILLAVDLTEPDLSARAVEVTTGIARVNNAAVTVTAVAPDFGMSIVGGFFSKDFEAKALQHAKDQLDSYADSRFPAEMQARTILGHGDVTEQVLKAAAKVKADLIVIASRQPDQMKDMMVSSSANRLARSAPVSLLIVRDG